MDKILRPSGLTAMDEEIARLVDLLKGTDPTSKDYETIVDNLRALCEAREKKNERAISYEMLIGVGANLLGLLIVLNFEKANVITSKAFSMLWKKS
jgi:hypothetical protein